MFKKCLSVFIVIFLFISVFPLQGFAENNDVILGDINTESKKTAVKEDGYIVKFTISNNSIYYLSIITQEHEDGLFERGKLTKCNLDGTNKTEVLQQNVIPYHDPTCPFNVTPENEIYTLIKVKGSETKFVAADIVLDGWAYGWAWDDPYNYDPENRDPSERFLGEAQIRLDGSSLYIIEHYGGNEAY